MNKNFIIAGAVILVLGLAIAIGVTLSSEPVAAGLPEGETTVTGDLLPEFAGENDDNIALGLAAPIFSAPNENSEIVISPSGSPAATGSELNVTPIAIASPKTRTTTPAIMKFLFN